MRYFFCDKMVMGGYTEPCVIAESLMTWKDDKFNTSMFTVSTTFWSRWLIHISWDSV